MAQTQKVRLGDAQVTWTVIDSGYLVVDPVEEWLEYLRTAVRVSPNTVKSYARGLALWWHFLEQTGHRWDDPGLAALTGFIQWLNSGDVPSRQPGRARRTADRLADATIEVRLAALSSFYEFHEHSGVIAPRLRGDRRPSPFRPFLAHLQDRRTREPAALLPRRRIHTGPTPVLLPDQVRLILDAAATRSDGRWMGNLRNRFLLEVLAETGLRLGEAMGLRHSDFVVGRGGTPYIEVIPREDNPNAARVKGMRWRRVFVSDRLERLYGEYLWLLADLADTHGLPLEDDQPVFVNTAGAPLLAMMGVNSVYRFTNRLHARLGGKVPAWTPHRFRHTPATALLLNGTPPHVVMRRLGHAHVQTTLDLYGWVTEEAELRSVAQWRRFADGWRITAEDAEDVA
jgi:site-specific recombinase XerD